MSRKDFYKKPNKFGAATLYSSKILDNVADKHWEEFHKTANSEEGLKIGDFIDVAVNVTAIQLVAFLDKFKEMESLDDVKTECDRIISEIQRDVELDD